MGLGDRQTPEAGGLPTQPSHPPFARTESVPWGLPPGPPLPRVAEITTLHPGCRPHAAQQTAPPSEAEIRQNCPPLRKKTHFLSVKLFQNVFNVPLLLPAALVLNWTFLIIWMPAQIIWQRLDCWQVGCCLGNFEFNKKREKKEFNLQNTKRPNRLLIGWEAVSPGGC